MGTEMTAVDTMYAFQVEKDDYVRFTDTSGQIRSGVVLDIEDLKDVFLITLSDDNEGDSETYEVSALEMNIEHLMYNEVAV